MFCAVLLAAAAGAITLAVLHTKHQRQPARLDPIPVQLPVRLASHDIMTAGQVAALDGQALEIAAQIPAQSAMCTIGAFDSAKYRSLLASKERFYLAMNLYNNEEILPNMIQEIIQLACILGPSRLHIAVFANGSTDRT